MFSELLSRLARVLDAADIAYMVIGGQAVLLYGEPRLTRDIDVTLALAPDHFPELLEVTQQLKLTPLVDPAAFVPETFVLPCQDEATSIRVDFIFSTSAYEQQAVQRVKVVNIEGTNVHFASVEDLLIHKMVAGRPRDLEDARSVLLKNTDIDADYIRRWLKHFEEALDRPLVDLFQEIRQTSR